MKKILLTTVLAIISIASVSAQFYTAQNKVWAFGSKVGLNFNTGSPVAFSTGLYTYEASASVCDASGVIRFYTDGKSVYNKTGTLMPNGASIVPYTTLSTTQGAIIMPFIGDTGKYYIFSLQNYEDTDVVKAKLSYSVVDMTLSGGLGDVVASSAGTFMYDSLTEGMAAITGNNNNIWLISRRKDTTAFVVFNITSTGVSATPTLYSAGTPLSCAQGGTIKASHDRRKLAISQYDCMDKVTLYDFDATTGAISNPQPIMTPGGTYNYGIEFSPDNSKIYVGTSYLSTATIKQYSLADPTSAAMLASEVTITDSAGYGAMRLAPDGKIYFPNRMTNTMGRINAPNNSGLACGLVLNALTTPHSVALGLPPIYVTADTNFVWVPPVAVAELASNSEVLLSPNPAAAKLTVSSPSPMHVIRVLNLIGQDVAIYNANNSLNTELDVANLPKGIYLIRIDDTRIRKFLKE